MQRLQGWGLAVGCSVLVACGGSSGPGATQFTADGGFVNPPSYRPCISNMECNAFESCSGVYGYSSGYVGVCTRGCFSHTDCSGDVCTLERTPQVCTRRCAVSSDCATKQVCGPNAFCIPDTVQSAECKGYVSCYEKTGGTAGSLDSTYGANGTCWTTTTAASTACTDACRSGLSALKSAYPSAGC